MRWYRRHRDVVLAKQRVKYAKRVATDPDFRENVRRSGYAGWIRNREHRLLLCKKYLREARDAALQALGYRCACCGEAQREFLAIDHPNGGGTQDLKKIGGNRRTYYLYVAQHPEQYRALCQNCNFSLGIYGYCPHKSSGLVATVHRSLAAHGSRKTKEDKTMATVVTTTGR